MDLGVSWTNWWERTTWTSRKESKFTMTPVSCHRCEVHRSCFWNSSLHLHSLYYTWSCRKRQISNFNWYNDMVYLGSSRNKGTRGPSGRERKQGETIIERVYNCNKYLISYLIYHILSFHMLIGRFRCSRPSRKDWPSGATGSTWKNRNWRSQRITRISRKITIYI